MNSYPTMESLALPSELTTWDGKLEPTTPSSSSDLYTIVNESSLEDWLSDEKIAKEILYITNGTLDSKLGIELTDELLNGEDIVVELADLKDGNWTATQSPGTLHSHHVTQILPYSGFDAVIATQPNLITKLPNGAAASYNISLDATSIYEPSSSSLTTLTPPQSPPRCSGTSVDLNSDGQQATLVHLTQQAAASPNASYIIQAPAAAQSFNVISAPSSGIDSLCATLSTNDHLAQTQIVDQILEEFAKDLPDYLSDDYDSSRYTSSPCSQTEENAMDEEWTPGSSPLQYECGYGSASSSSSSSCASSSYDDEKPFVSVKAAANHAIASAGPAAKKRTRPYGRGVEDRKIRKKEQNKNAATRYRQKKKLEMEQVFVEEEELSQRNKELKSKLADCVREMKYLKSLIREVYGLDDNNKAK